MTQQQGTQMLGRYALVDRIGQGGMAEIWRAKATGPSGFEKTVAIKRVLPHLLEQDKFIEMFISEAKLAATLHHPNIVEVFDFGRTDEGDYYIAMEFVAGAALNSIMKALRAKKITRLPPELALYIVAEAAKGLHHAHNQVDDMGNPFAIVHRDISPHNLLVSFSGHVKVVDFGIAKVVGALGSTETGMVKGKLNYMSPEQACSRPMDHRSDVFSLGLVLYELLTGDTLFDGETVPEIAMKILKYDGPPQEVLNRLTRPVATILGSVLQADPDVRYQSAAALEEAIGDVLGLSGIKAAQKNLGQLVAKLIPKKDTSSSVPVLVRPTGENDPTMAKNLSVSSQRIERGGTLLSSAAVPKTRRGWVIPTAITGALMLVAAIAVIKVATQKNAEVAVTPTPHPVESIQPTQTPRVVALASPAPTRRQTPVRRRTPRPTARSATPVATQAPPIGRMGKLTVTARPWVEVWVDGKRIKRETPLSKYPLKPGKHTVRFKNAVLKFDATRNIVVRPGKTTSIHVDAASGKIEL